MTAPTETRAKPRPRGGEVAPVPTKRTPRDAIRTWNPHPGWFVPLMVGVVLYNLAALPVWAGLSPWVMALVGMIGTAVLTVAAHRRFNADDYGRAHNRRVLVLSLVTGAVASAWLVFAAIVRPTDMIALGLLALALVAVGAVFALVRSQAPKQKQQQQQVKEQFSLEQAEQHKEYIEERTAAQHSDLMAQAGLEGVKVIKREETVFGFRLTLRDRTNKPVKYAGIQGAVGSLASILSAELEGDGIELGEQHVRAEETGSAHLFHINVRTKDVFKMPIDYPLGQPVGSIRNTVAPGLYEDLAQVLITILAMNGIMVGATGSGKTVFLNNLIAAVTRTNDAVVWLGATKKFTPLVLPWLAPWLLGKTNRPLIDYVAGPEPYRVLEMLADFYKLVCERNDELGAESKFTPSPQDPAVITFIDEASDLLDRHSDVKILTHEGNEWNASRLVDAIMAINRAAGSGMWLLTQQGLIDAFGPYGTMLRRNAVLRVAGQTTTDYDGTATLVGLDNVRTTRLRNYELLIQANVERPRAVPFKAFYLDGLDLIGPLAEVNTAHKPVLPMALKMKLSKAYQDRWSAERLPSVVKAAKKDLGVDWPARPHDTQTPVSSEPPVGDTNEKTEAQKPEAKPTRTATKEEVRSMTQQAHTKMQNAIEAMEMYGPLGRTMAPIMEVLLAEDCPEFTPAWMLAVVSGLTPRDAEKSVWLAAGDDLVKEIAGAPWYLEAEERAGDKGWTRQALLDRMKEFLKGEPAASATPSVPEQRPAQVREPLRTLLAALEGDDRQFITSTEAAQIVGNISAAELQRVMEGEFDLPVQRPRLDGDEGESRPRGWFLADLRRAAIRAA